MLSCSCEIGRYTYRFSTTRLSFNGASTACRSKGGRLARFLTRSGYEELNNCCSKGEYWIGLVDRGGCPQNEPYRWDTTSMCRSAAPLTVTTQPNDSGCEGVGILTAGSRRKLPMAREINCDQSQQFICQYLPLPTTRSATTKKSIATRTISRTSTTSSTARIATTASFTSVATSFPVSLHTSPYTIAKSTQSETNAAIITSIILGSIILLLLFAIFCYWRRKKSESEKKKNCSATSEQPVPSLVQFKQTGTSNRNQEHLCYKYV